MIASVSGSLVHKTAQVAVIEVQGVGYQIQISLGTFARLPEPPTPVTLYTRTYLREDTLQLYGFPTLDERDLFVILLGVNGIGPKLALSILSAMTVEEFGAAARSGEPARFAVVPGIGKKIAARLALELKEKPLPVGVGDTRPSGLRQVEPEAVEDVLSALVHLGYRRQRAEEVVKKVASEHDGDLAVEALIKESLKRLSRG